MHMLINVTYNPREKKKLRKWSGSCRCKQWNGMAPTKESLTKLFKQSHKNSIGVIL